MSKLAEYMAEDGIYLTSEAHQIEYEWPGLIEWHISLGRNGSPRTFHTTRQMDAPVVLLEAFATITRDIQDWHAIRDNTGRVRFTTYLREICEVSPDDSLAFEQISELEDAFELLSDDYRDFLIFFNDEGDYGINNRAARYLDLTPEDLDEAENEVAALKEATGIEAPRPHTERSNGNA